MKKFLNNSAHIVSEMCRGILMAHPELEFDGTYKVLKKKTLDKNKVSLISGGGSGHEPAHAGFIGEGMLDAAVCGDVFASPSQVQVYQAIRQTAGNKGTLLIIKNYSGDMMNFMSAASLAQQDGILVDFVKVDDDIAVQDSLYTVGRRGVAGTIFVHKIAGAAASQGCSLPEVKAIAEKTIAQVKSLGIALTSCTVPAKGSPTFELAEHEIEYGIGIHGEPGIRREKLKPAKEMVSRMADSLCEELQAKSGDRVAVLVNGFGATPLMELYLLNGELYKELSKRGVFIVRSFVGNYMTSIDMAGASISILKLDDQLEKFLNAPCSTPALNICGPVQDADIGALVNMDEGASAAYHETEQTGDGIVKGSEITIANLIFMVDVMADTIIKNEQFFCELDSHAGDGDFGASVAKGFRQLRREWKDVINQPKVTIGSFLDACSMIIMEHCGGASGPIWGSAFRAAAKCVGAKTKLDVKDFALMMQAAVNGIQTTGERSFGRGAIVGDKTLIDALVPCADAWTECASNSTDAKTAFVKAAQAAVEGAQATENMAAKMGRAATAGQRSIGYPDAGAHALGVLFTEIAQQLRFG